ncbi:MAG: hypothetical protein JXQ75_12635 [Phycisphaerae bacterium]|nr:hypothetical protein [Phycisphaerae bacterium]
MQPPTQLPSTSLPTWNAAVLAALRSFPGPVTLGVLYTKVRGLAPGLVAGNPQHADDKIRQVVQRLARQGLANHVRKGIWEAARK